MRSTLPDLFKSDLNVIKFHPQDRPRKIGGRFAINLNTHHTLNSSPEKSQLQLKKLESTTGFTRSIYDGGANHARSHSINHLAPALKQQSSYGNNSLHKARKSVNFVNEPTYMSTRNQSVSALSRETPTLQQIFIQNTIKNNAMSQRVPGYGFPYETTRSMNNMKIEMEEADSFKNRVETIVKEQAENEKVLGEIVKQEIYIKDSMAHFRQAYLEDLEMFEEGFRFMCKDLMKGLSLMRRQTGEQTKINQADTERLYYEFKDSGAILNLLEARTNLLREDCIDDQKIQLTNSKTYSQDIQMRIYQSQKQTQLDKMFRRTKRSGTSQDFRAGTSQSMRTGTGRISSRNVLLKDRAQTTQLQGRFINGNIKNMNKEDEQDLGFQELNLNEDKQNGKLSQLMDQLSINTNNNFKNRQILNHQEQLIQDY